MELLKAFLILIFIYLAITFISIIIRKFLHLNKKGILTNRHINPLHKRVDRYVKAGSFLLFILTIMMFPRLSFNALLLVILALAALDYFVRIYFLFKYTTERKEIIVDLIELLLWVIAVVFIITCDLFQPYI